MDEEANVFRINKAFAANYDRYRQKEELQKLKDKYGDVPVDESSSSETEDEDAEALTEQLEKDWLRAYAAVKSRDPKIYEKNVQFYQSGSGTESGKSPKKSKSKSLSKKEKPVTLKDYERKLIIEKGGVLSDEEGENYSNEPTSLGYYEEQDEIKKSFKKALLDSEDSDDDLLVHRPKSENEKAVEEEEYRDWLKGQKDDLEESEKFGQELLPLKEYWTDPKLEDGEKFLRDYILNKGYLEKDKDRIPTYEEIVEEAGFSEDEEILHKQEQFEMKFNFRYEEPDPEFIKRYPRTISESVRRSDNKRSKKRADVKDRKEMEKQKKREELKQLKNLKKKEIVDKIERLKEVTGNPSLGMSEEDIEGDFDPQKYDKLMQKMFNNDYYGEEEVEKPVFSDNEDLEIEDWDNWQGGDDDHNEESTAYQEELHADDPNFNMDADYDPNAAPIKLKKESKKQKKKSKFAKAVTQSKPVFDPSEKSFEKYLEEYYKLDYEDIIGDLPCRFKYRKTVPNDYGLSVGEILAADEKELNTWCSVKKMSQYKGEEEEYLDLKKYRKKTKKKYNVITSLNSRDSEKPGVGKPRMVTETVTRATEYSNESGDDGFDDGMEGDSSGLLKEKHKRDVDDVVQSESETNVEESIEQSHNELSENSELKDSSSPKKRKKKRKSVISSEETESDNVKTCMDSEPDGLKSPVKKQKHIDDKSGNEMPANSVKSKADKQKRKRKGKKKQNSMISDERLKAYGINPKRFKQLQKQTKTS